MHFQSLYFIIIFLTYMELMGWPVNSLTNMVWEEGSFGFHSGFPLSLSSPYIKEKASTEGRQASDGAGETPHWLPWSCCTPRSLPRVSNAGKSTCIGTPSGHIYDGPLLWWDRYPAHCLSLRVPLWEIIPVMVTNTCVFVCTCVHEVM